MFIILFFNFMYLFYRFFSGCACQDTKEYAAVEFQVGIKEIVSHVTFVVAVLLGEKLCQ